MSGDVQSWSRLNESAVRRGTTVAARVIAPRTSMSLRDAVVRTDVSSNGAVTYVPNGQTAGASAWLALNIQFYADGS